MNLTPQELTDLRAQGFILQKDKEYFSLRVVVPAGQLSSDCARKLADIADKYGRGYFTTTLRLDVHIPWIKYESIDAIAKELREVNLFIGGEGPRIRSIHTCKGSVCRFGLYDTDAMTFTMYERFYKGYYDMKLPHKLRIILSGCPNSCSKAQTACIGVVGKKMGKVAVVIGGQFGREKQLARELQGIYTPEEALEIIDRGIKFFKENGQPKERFAKMVNRLGFEVVEAAMLATTTSAQ